MQNIPDFLTIPAAELPKHSKVPVTILPDQEALFTHFARSIADEIKTNNQKEAPTRLILPVGPVGGYPYLVRMTNEEHISWKSVYCFNMDEYCDWQGRAIPMTHPLSFKGFMFRQVYEKILPELRPPESHFHFPDPLNLDKISEDIQQVGGVDTCYGGIGYHGHVAFNEPPISRWIKITPEEFRNSLTRVVTLAPDTIVMNSIRNTGGNPAIFPPKGVTLGLRDILSAKRMRNYLAGGVWQRNALRMTLMGDESVEYPTTLLQTHPDHIVITDEDTAQPISPSV